MSESIVDYVMRKVTRKIELQMAGCANETDAKLATINHVLGKWIDEQEFLQLMRFNRGVA